MWIGRRQRGPDEYARRGHHGGGAGHDLAISAVTSTAPPAATVKTATTVAGTSAAATAVIEPDAVAGVPLGSNKTTAIAALGPPTASGQETDLSGKKYDFLRWQLAGNRGLTLNFRTDSATSPLLTDWTANAPGPVTKGGVQVGDAEVKVTAAHDALQAFCCDTRWPTSPMAGAG